jgi:hypothetical protein
MMKNIQMIKDTEGCNKYCIKYVGKIDEKNYNDNNNNNNKV